MANVKKLKIKDTTYNLDAYNADSATKLKTARSIALGTGVTGTATNFDGSSNITIPVTSVKESYLAWGGKNFSGSWGPIDAAMVPNFAANRFAFLPASAITSEYSTNGGSTWTATTSSSARENIFANGGGFTIGNSTATGVDKKNYKCRITITTSGVVYTTLNKFAIRISSNGSSGCHVKIESRTKANQDAGTNTWATNCERAELGGWPGWNIVNISPITTHGNTTAQYSQIRFTFGVDSHASSVTYYGLQVLRIMAFGGEGWSTPSNMANDGHLYSYDSAQNATFPAKVTATGFSGPLTGNATTASGIKDSANSSTITASYASAQLAYSDITHLACWNGYQLRAINKSAFVGNNSDSISAALNRLGIGNDTPSDNDFYICQYAGGGTTTTSYHRRPVYALWNYIKGKTDNAYVAKGTIATTSTPGLVKPVSVITKPTLNSVTTTSGRYYSVQMSSDGSMFVNVPWQAVPNDYYHSTGSWNGLTYTATAHEGAPDLKFTLPTGTTGTTVALGNHTHSQYLTAHQDISGKANLSGATFTGAVTITSGVNLKFNKIQVPVSSGSSTYSNGNNGQVLKSNGTTVYWAADDNTDADSKTSSSNTTNKIYLVGATSQSSAGQTTYSNSSCYASGGYLYSNGKKVDMDNISGGVEWSTF